MVRQIFETGGKGHSCGIYSFDDEHIHQLALRRAGQPDHGAASAVELERRHLHQRHADDVEHGLRHLGRQHHQREHPLKHYMNVTWVSRPIAEDRPSDQELFGEFYNSETF